MVALDMLIFQSIKEKKLDDRAYRCVLIGYADRTRGYRLWSNELNRVIETKHVRFDESRYGLTESKETTRQLNHGYDDALELIWDDSGNTDVKVPNLDDSGNIDVKDDEDAEMNSEPGTCDEQDKKNSVKRTVGRPKKRTRNPYGCKGKPVASELNFLEINEPKTYEEAVISPESKFWRDAMDNELKNIKERKTWTVSRLPFGKIPISSKWVFRIKRNAQGKIQRFKARLVARGFSQRPGIDYGETYSPVVSFDTIRLLFALTLNQNWVNRHLDVDCAYLYGNLEEEIYMTPPPGLSEENCENKVLRLLKPLYGLRQSGRNWNFTLDKALEEIGFIRLKSSSCIYKYEEKALLAVYVDDLALFAESDIMLGSSIVIWRSRKQQCVSLSTMESEYIALSQTVKEVVWLLSCLKEIDFMVNSKITVPVFVDNKAAIDFSTSRIEKSRTKHIDIRFHFVRDFVQNGVVRIKYVESTRNLADIFTKALPKFRHQNMCKMINFHRYRSQVGN